MIDSTIVKVRIGKATWGRAQKWARRRYLPVSAVIREAIMARTKMLEGRIMIGSVPKALPIRKRQAEWDEKDPPELHSLQIPCELLRRMDRCARVFMESRNYFVATALRAKVGIMGGGL